MPMTIPPVPGHPGYVSGQWYSPGTAGAGSAKLQDVLYFIPILIHFPLTVNGIGFLNASAVVGNAKLGIYTNSAGRPGTLVAENDADLSTNVGLTSVSGVFTSNPTLGAGWYWLASVFSAAANVYGINAASTGAISNAIMAAGADFPVGAIGSGGFTIRRTAALAYVAGGASFMPASAGACTATNGGNGSPIVAVKAA